MIQIKAAARMLIGHQLASVDKVFENASARAEFQRVIGKLCRTYYLKVY